MSRSLCILLSMALAASAGRVATISKVDDALSTPPKVGGDHKCTITWPVSAADVTPVVEAKISFSMDKKKLFCSATSDYRSDSMFGSALAFKLEPGDNRCFCQDQWKNQVTYFVGHCTDKDAPKKCWEQYKRLVTNKIKPAPAGTKTPTIESHYEKMTDSAENGFAYAFDKDACKEKGSCDVEVVLPGMGEGRSQEEMKVIADVVTKIKSGEITAEESGIGEIIDSLSETDIHNIFLQDKWNSLYEGMRNEEGVVTVGMLKAAYEERLAGSGISVSHMMYVAGLDARHGERVLEYDEFVMFLNPDCSQAIPANGLALKDRYTSMIAQFSLEEAIEIDLLMAKHGISAKADAAVEEEAFKKFADEIRNARLYAEYHAA